MQTPRQMIHKQNEWCMCPQTEGNDDSCGMIGSLFDESAVGSTEAEPVAWSDDDTPGTLLTRVISWLHCITAYLFFI